MGVASTDPEPAQQSRRRVSAAHALALHRLHHPEGRRENRRALPARPLRPTHRGAQRSPRLPLLRKLQPGLRRRLVLLPHLVHDPGRGGHEESHAADQCARAERAGRRERHGQGRGLRRSQSAKRSGSLRQGRRAGRLLRRDRAHHAEFEVAALAHGHREFQRTARPQSVRAPVRRRATAIFRSSSASPPRPTTSPTPRWPGCRAGRISRTRGRKNSSAATRSTWAAVAESSLATTASSKALARSSSAISSATIPTSIGALIQAPSLPSPTNYVDIDPDKKDIFGIPQLRFHFQWGQNELLMWEHSKQVMVDLFKAMGGELWGADDEPNRPGNEPARNRGLPLRERSEDVRHEQVGADSRCSQSLHLRREHLSELHRQDHHDADCRLHHAHLRSHARQLQERRPHPRLTLHPTVLHYCLSVAASSFCSITAISGFDMNCVHTSPVR